jgi:hypothetical protein
MRRNEMSKVILKIGTLVVAFALLMGPMSAFASDSKVADGAIIYNMPAIGQAFEPFPASNDDRTANAPGYIKDPVKVMVICTNPSKVAQALSGIPYRGFLGQRENGEIISPVLLIPRSAIDILRGTDGVLAILDYDDMLRKDRTNAESIFPDTGDGNTISSLFDTKQHYGSEAWSKGFTGEGITVAVTEFGIDFSQPDLMGTQARVTDTASPYYGWPMVFDSTSLTAYLSSNGNTTGTWFADTSTECAINYTKNYDMLIDSEIEWRLELEVTNETVYGPAKGGETGPFYLDYKNIVSHTFYLSNSGNWSKLILGTHYTFSASTGTITLKSPALAKLAAGMVIHAYYNYTNPYTFEVTSGIPSPAAAGSPESIVLDGFTPGKPYVFAVRATDEAGNMGPISNSQIATAKDDTIPPSKISNLAAVPGRDNGTVALSWTAPGDDAALGTASSYLIRYSKLPITNIHCFRHLSSEIYNLIIPATPGTGENHIAMDLEAGQFYFAVVAVDEAGNWGPVSNTIRATVTKDTAGPEAISGFTATAVGANHTGVILNWTAPHDEGATGSACVMYEGRYSPNSIITQTDWDAATEIPSLPVPATPGTAQTAHVITGVDDLTILTVANESVYGPAVGDGTEDGPWYLDNVDTTDLTLYRGYDDAGSWALQPLQQGTEYTFDAPTSEINLIGWGIGTSTIENELAYTSTYDDEMVDGLFLANENLQDINIYYDYFDVERFPMEEGVDYECNYTTGWITFIGGWLMYTDETLWAFYNYTNLATSLQAGDYMLAYYNYTAMMPINFALRGVDELGRFGAIAGASSLVAIDETAPAQATGLTAETGTLHGMVYLNFTAPGDDGAVGTAKRFYVKHSSNPITNDAEFSSATEWIWADPYYTGTMLPELKWTPPVSGGQIESHQFGYGAGTQILPITPLYFAVKAMDEAGNIGPLASCPTPVVVRNDITPPATIALTAVTGPVEGSVVLSWIAPGDDGTVGQLYNTVPYSIKWSASPIDTAQKFDDANGMDMDIAKSPGENEAVTVRGLVGGQQYYFAVCARDDANLLGGLPVNIFATAKDDETAPGAVTTFITLTGDQNGQVKLNFIAPGNDGNTGSAFAYEIRYRDYVPMGQFIQYGFDRMGVLNITDKPNYYNVTGITSQSGLYKIGMHMDQNLAKYVNGNLTMGLANYSAVLVVDSATPYVYDTVYVDLDHDMDFSDENPCTKGNEASFRDMDGDGFADLSGGMIYFIGSATTVPSEALTIGGGGTYAVASHGNVVNNSWIVFQNGIPFSMDKYTVNLNSTGYLNITFEPALTATAGFTLRYEYNGLALPYSKRYSERYEMKNVIPGNGDLVAFMGEFNLDSSYGTSMASSIVGQGYLPLLDDTSIRPVVGMAPDAKIIAVADIGFDGIIFALEGYDGIPMTGDEANIVSSSWASSSVYESGLDFTSNYMDWLATTYCGGRSSIVVTAGEKGPGYGTVSSPGAASGVITAGLASDLYYRAIGGAYENGPLAMCGDVVAITGRGPTVAGNPKPDFVAAGGYFGFVSQPLYMPDAAPLAPYNNLVELWMYGHGLTSAVASAGLALVYQAYGTAPHLEIDDRLEYSIQAGQKTNVTLSHKNVDPATFKLYRNGTQVSATNYTLNGTAGTLLVDSYVLRMKAVMNASYVHTDSVPQGSEAHEILMSGADDLSYDIFTQGAGQLNASKSVDIASGSAGLSVSPVNWVPGDFEGARYETFVKLVSQDTSVENMTETFTVRNYDDASKQVTVKPQMMSKLGEVVGSVTTTIANPHESLILNETGLYMRDGRVITLMNSSLWNDAELLRITAYNENDTGYWLELFAWTDVNGNGIADGDKDPDPYPGAVAFEERNRMMMSTVYTNRHEATVHDPAQRLNDGILIWIRSVGGPTYDNCKWTVKAEAYGKAAWDLITVNQASLDISGNSYGTFTATVDRDKVLAAGPGTYDGMIKVGGADGALIPVVINVPLGDSEIEPLINSMPLEIADRSFNRSREVLNETCINKNQMVDGDFEFYLKHTGTEQLKRVQVSRLKYTTYKEVVNTTTWNVTIETTVQWLDWVDIPAENFTVDPKTGLAKILNQNEAGPTYMLYWNATIYTWYSYNVDGVPLAHSNVIPGSLEVYKDGTVTSEYGSVTGALAFKNRNDVVDEFIINATGGETTVSLANGAGPEMVSGCTVYLNGIALWDGVDYTLDKVNGIIYFQVPLKVGMVITADYYTYDPDVKQIQLANTELSPGRFDINNPNGYNIYLNSVPLGAAEVDVNITTGLLTFAKAIPPGAIVEADYKYGTYIPDYSTGVINFLIPPALGTNITAKYKYYDSPSIYEHSYMIGGSAGSGSGKAGDWRFYYTSLVDGPLNRNPNYKVVMDVSWGRSGSDIDSFLFTQADISAPKVGTASFEKSRYGPYALTNSGGSSESATLFTASGGPSDFAMAPPTPGLNVLALHNVRFNGTMGVEAVSGRIGRMSLGQDSINIITNRLVGEETISAYSSLDLGGRLSGVAAGPSAPEVRQDLLVYQDDPDWENFIDFEEQLASGQNLQFITLKDCLIFNVRIIGHDDTYTREGSFNDVVDLDLGVFLDSNANGKPDYGEMYAMDADFNADEQVKLISPPDGNYIIVAYGFTLKTEPGHYDMEITIVQGLGFTVSGEGEDTTPDKSEMWISSEPLPAYTKSSITLGYNLPGAKNGVTLQGALFLGPGSAPYAMLMPISLRYDTIPPNILGTAPAAGTTTNSVLPTVVAEFSDTEYGDLVTSGAKILLDGVDVTGKSTIGVEIRDKTVDDGMYTSGTSRYTPLVPLKEGIHTVAASMYDKAGNEALKTWSFTIDTSAPSLTLDDAFLKPVFTASQRITITGVTERGATLRAFGGESASIAVDSDGKFSIDIVLNEGENTVHISSTDSIGNSASCASTIYYDSTMPSFISVRFSNGFTTNNPNTVISGKASESGTISVNGMIVTVNSDGSFERALTLAEGLNTFHLQLTDNAGNSVHSWQNVTLDTVAPTIIIIDAESKVRTPTFTLAGTVEPGSELFINGKRIDIGTRQSSGVFNTTLTISPGSNIIVIEAEDSAGNIAELRHIVEYDTSGTNYGAIGLMVVLLILGFILGMFLAPFLAPLFAKKEEPEAEPVEGEIPAEGAEDQPSEDEMPTQEEGQVDLESDEDALETEELEPIPAEESLPEDMPEDSAPEAEVASGELEPEESVPSEPEEPAAEPPADEDPRITKLTEAYKNGKISKELYEKNLARFKND